MSRTIPLKNRSPLLVQARQGELDRELDTLAIDSGQLDGGADDVGLTGLDDPVDPRVMRLAEAVPG